MGNVQQRKEKMLLTAETIDQLSIICSQALQEAEADRKDIIRVGLSLEEILEIWLTRLGEGAPCLCRTGVRFGKQFFEVRVAGEEMGLAEEEDDSGLGRFMYNRLLAQAGLALVYSYKDGANCLTVNPPKRVRISQIAKLLIAIALAVACGLLFTLLSPTAQGIIQDIKDPLYTTLLGIIRTIASLLILLAICCGIVSVGDLSLVGVIGKKIITRLCIIPLIMSVFMVLGLMWFFPITTGGTTDITSGAGEIYQMLLGIFPGDLVSPFLHGNALQIILLGAFLGIAILVLGERAAMVRTFVNQVNEVVKYLMEIVCKLIPLFVFLSIFSLISSGTLNEFSGVLKALVLVVALCLIALSGYITMVMIKTGVSFGVLVKKMLPVFLICISTASSPTALSTNMETCQHKLGMPGKIVDFAVPLGQVLFKPGHMIIFLTISLCMAENFLVNITPVWLVTAVIMAVLLSIALPPVPGATTTCFTVMFAQLGIPFAALAVAIALDSILDFVATASSIACLQNELTLATDKLGMLDKDLLRKG